MPTPAYPSRGTWEFYNETGDFPFWMVLGSINIQQGHINDVAILSGIVIDLDASLSWSNEDLIWAKFGGTRIFAGNVKVIGDAWSDDAGLGVRRFDIEAQDFTPRLADALIRRRADRKREKAKRRARWLLRYMANVFPVDWDLSGVPDVYVEKANHYGYSVDDGLETLDQDARLFHYLDFDDDEDGVPTVHIFRNETLPAPWNADNDTPDLATSFPFRQFWRERDSVQLANAVLVEPSQRGKARWSRNASSINLFGRRERFISDVNLKNVQQAVNTGERSLAQYDTPLIHGRFVAHEPGLYAGMTFELTEALHQLEQITYVIESVTITASDAHDADQTAYLKTQVGFANRRRRKRRGGSTRAANKTARGRQGEVADVDPVLIDAFGRTVAPPTIIDGSGAGSFVFAGIAVIGRESDEAQTDIPFSFATGALGQVTVPGSYVGAPPANPHTSRPSWTSCGAFDNAFAGYLEYEKWYKLTVPAHPGSMAGIKVTLATDDPGGWQGPSYGAVASMLIAVRTGPPTAMRQGTVIGSLAANSSATLTIPGGLVPDAGNVLYLGYRPSWQNEGIDDPERHVCGFIWPFMCPSYLKDSAGIEYAGHSGRMEVIAPGAATWRTYSVAEQDYGATSPPATAPWGPHQWVSGGSSGSPVAEIDGEALTVTATANSAKSFVLQGERENPDEEWGPWSDMSFLAEAVFEIDALGSTTEAGVRRLELVATGEGEKVFGYVHFGDTSREMGIEVIGPASADYKAITLTTGERWKVRIDTRSGYVRAKLWKASERMPTGWHVSAAMDETEDDADNLTLTFRVGNVTGSQSCRVHRISMQAGAPAGARIVSEYLGVAPGTSSTFYTSHQFEPGSLVFGVNGHRIRPSASDSDLAKGILDGKPTAGSRMRATYTVA